jgi:hypothetical protein
MNRLLIATAIATIAFSTPISAAQIDYKIFWNCLSFGYTVDQCVDEVNAYHHETTQSGVTILRGQTPSNFRPEFREVPAEQ